MTRQIIFSFLLILFLQVPDLNQVNTAKIIHTSFIHTSTTLKMDKAATADHSIPLTGNPTDDVGMKPATHKIHLLKIEELAKIHRFHKERVKKIKRHHKKYWALAKTILVLCHLVLLISAFLHLAH